MSNVLEICCEELNLCCYLPLQILFEKFEIPELYVAVPALLSLYSSGRTSGIVVESGEGNTHMLAIYGGYCIKEATHRTNLAGQEMTNYLTRLLNKKGYSFATSGKSSN